MDQLRVAPVSVIQGVMCPSGVGASRSQGDVLWNMSFSLAYWCVDGGEIKETELVVRKEISDDELGSYRSLLPNYGVVCIHAHLLETSDFDSAGRPQALLVEIASEPHPHPELVQLSNSLQEPCLTPDEQFGVFTLDRSVNWHEAETRWEGAPVRLTLDTEDPKGAFPHNSLSQARRLWSEAPKWAVNVRSTVIQKLLELKNDGWLEDGEQPLSADDFWGRVKLQSITVRADGSFEFWYDDGDLFWGHSIMADGSFTEGFTDAGIHG